MTDFKADVIYSLFGAADAENESADRLKQYFYRNRAYESLIADVPIRIVVGHKGVGKSALLKMAHLEDLDADRPSIWLQPSDLSTLDDTYDQRFDKATLAWQQGLLKVLYQKAEDMFMGIGNRDQANVIMASSKDLMAAIKKLAKKRLEIETNETQRALVSKFDDTNRIFVYIDDLDRGWQGRRADILRLSALLNSLRDICGEYRGIQFRIGLRSDVYHLVRTSDESTDKVSQYIVPLNWTSHDILICFAKRVATYFGEDIDDNILEKMPQKEIARRFHRVIEPTFQGLGKWENAPIHIILLSLTRRRPRDLVKLLSGAANAAFNNRHKIITSHDLQSTFVSYSQDRLQDIINEFQSELPNIKSLLTGMRPNKTKRLVQKTFLYSNDELSKKLADIKSSSSLIFANGDPVNYHTLRQFLYKIDFILARNNLPDGKVEWVYFEENRFASNSSNDFGYDWEVHPAYRWALERQTVDKIISEIDLHSMEA